MDAPSRAGAKASPPGSGFTIPDEPSGAPFSRWREKVAPRSGVG